MVVVCVFESSQRPRLFEGSLFKASLTYECIYIYVTESKTRSACFKEHGTCTSNIISFVPQSLPRSCVCHTNDAGINDLDKFFVPWPKGASRISDRFGPICSTFRDTVKIPLSAIPLFAFFVLAFLHSLAIHSQSSLFICFTLF